MFSPAPELVETKVVVLSLEPMDKDLKDERTHAIIGAAMEVHGQLGQGFLEAVYQDALAIELLDRSIPFVREPGIPVHYKNRLLVCSCWFQPTPPRGRMSSAAPLRADFVCYGEIIVELKALRDQSIIGAEQAQLLNYLKATGLECGLLLNFGRPSLEFKRLIFSNRR